MSWMDLDTSRNENLGGYNQSQTFGQKFGRTGWTLTWEMFSMTSTELSTVVHTVHTMMYLPKLPSSLLYLNNPTIPFPPPP